MKLSLRFFSTKLNEQFPGTSMKLSAKEMPTFSTLGVITEEMAISDEVIYIDILKNPEEALPSGISAITTKARAKLFKRCNLITLPDETDLVKVTESVSKVFALYLSWADSIYEAIAKNMDLQAIIDLTAEIIKNPMYISDSSFKMLASWGGDLSEVNPTWRYQEKYSYLPYDVMQNLIETGEFEKIQNLPRAWLVKNSRGFTAFPYISKAIRKEGVHYGNFFIIELYNQLNDCDLEIADYLGMVLSTALYGNLNYLEKSTLYNAHFLAEIIEGTLTDTQIMVDQLRALRWGLEGDYLLALFDTAEDTDAIRHHMMAFLSTDLSAQCIGYRGDVLVILNNSSKRIEKIITRLKQVGHDFNRTVTVSECFIDFQQIGKYYKQSRFILDHLGEATEKGRLVRYSEIYLEHLAHTINDTIPLFAPAIKLKQHDDKHHTEYCNTLLTWLINERNNVKTAEALFVHRNTLKNRLERIIDIVDISIDDFGTRERLTLSLYILRQKDLHNHNNSDLGNRNVHDLP